MGRILTGGGSVNLKATVLYSTATAPSSQPVDTYITPDILEHYDELSVNLIMQSAGGIRYALPNVIKTIGVNDPYFEDLHFTRSIEMIDQIGDLTMSFWLDSVTGTIQYQYDSDGSGITFVAVVIQAYSYVG